MFSINKLIALRKYLISLVKENSFHDKHPGINYRYIIEELTAYKKTTSPNRPQYWKAEFLIEAIKIRESDMKNIINVSKNFCNNVGLYPCVDCETFCKQNIIECALWSKC